MSSTPKRSIAEKILAFFSKHPDDIYSIDSDNLDNDQHRFHTIFKQNNENITVAKDPDKGKLWFKKK